MTPEDFPEEEVLLAAQHIITNADAYYLVALNHDGEMNKATKITTGADLVTVSSFIRHDLMRLEGEFWDGEKPEAEDGR